MVISKEQYPLHTAVASNDLVKLKQLLDAGVNVDAPGGFGDTPLILASKKGNLKAFEVLLERGANVNAIDNYKQSSLYYAVTKFSLISMYNRNDDYSDIAAILIKKGAENSPIRVDPGFFLKTIKTLSLKHEDMACDFLKKEFHRESFHSNPDYIKKHIQDYLSSPPSKESLTKILDKLINVDFKYENKLEAIRHLSHLNSWTGEIVDYDYQIEAEGWLMNRYPPLKVKTLLQSLRKVNDGSVDSKSLFQEPKERIQNKLISEIGSQLSTYYSQINQETIRDLEHPKMRETALDEEARKLCQKISQLSPGQEFAIASGFPGHAIYIGFRKSVDGSLSRLVYNLGGGIKDKHVFSSTGRVYPDVIKGIPPSSFQGPNSVGSQYIKGIIEAKLGLQKEYLPFIYDNGTRLGGERILEGFIQPSQKRQLAGNCVLKNNNAALRNRLRNDKLFKWLKQEEIKVAYRVSDIGSMEFGSKERAKDVLSLNYIVKEFQRTRNPLSASENFNLFFRKRLDLSNKNPENPFTELSDFLQTNQKSSKLKDWLAVDGVKKLLDSLLQENKINKKGFQISL